MGRGGVLGVREEGAGLRPGVVREGEKRVDPEILARPHLTWADEEGEERIEESLQQVRRFFREAKKGTRPFAEEVLGFRSKMKLVWDGLPLTEKTHPKFVREKFDERIFSPEELEEVIEGAVTSYLAEVEGIEGEMLVRLRTDMADFPQSYEVERLDPTTLRKEYDHAIDEVLKASGEELTQATTELLVSTVAGEVLTIVALRVGVSAGILSAGGVSGTVTLGVGVLVGLIADQIVSYVWDWYADPKGDLAMTLNSRLDDLSLLITNGAEGKGGLKKELNEVARRRAAVRREAVMKVLGIN